MPISVGLYGKKMEQKGIEPLASCMRNKRSTN